MNKIGKTWGLLYICYYFGIIVNPFFHAMRSRSERSRVVSLKLEPNQLYFVVCPSVYSPTLADAFLVRHAIFPSQGDSLWRKDCVTLQ